jgi:uncharacterized surface protein with fasciclin (FAS1) repeats
MMVDCKKVFTLLVLLAFVMGLSVPFAAAQIGSQRNILENLAGIGDFSTLLSAVRTAGLDGTLKGPGPYTLFAPGNAAFDKLPKDSLDALMKDPVKLGDLLKYHAVPGKIGYGDLARLTDVKTVDGKTLPINFKDGALYVGGTKVLNQGIESSNGIIYPVEGVLVPPGFAMPQKSKLAPLSILGWLVGALIVGGLAIYLLTRGKKEVAKHEEKLHVDQEKIVLDESAMDEISRTDRSRLAGLHKYIIGSYNDLKDRVDLVKDYSMNLMDIRDSGAVKKLSDLYALSPFNSNALELALEKDATIYTRDPALMDKYRAAGAKTADIKKLIY